MEYTVYINQRGAFLPTLHEQFTNIADARKYAIEVRSHYEDKFVVETPIKQFTASKFKTLYGGGAWVYGYWPETNEEIVISGWN